MEKQKLQPGPKPRIKRTALPPPGDFIALGSKSTAGKPRQNESDLSKPLSAGIRKPNLGLPAHTVSGQKRKDLSPVNPVAAKQSRTFSPSFNRNKEKILDSSQILPSVKFVDAPAIELEEMVLNALKQDDQDLIDGLICNAVKILKINRLKPEPMLYLTLMTLAKSHPVIFSSKKIVEHLLQFLRRENSLSAVKPKPNTLLSIMTCNIFLHAFQNEDVWPQSFMKVYIEDALGDRSWVDNENNKGFVLNLTKIFGTTKVEKTPPPPTIKITQEQNVNQTDTLGNVDKKGEEEMIIEDLGISIETDEPALIRNRFATQKDELAIQTHILDIVKEQLNKRQMIDSLSRNFLRFLTSVCGYVEIRLLASQRMETWLQNPKLTRPTQELLMSVVLNCNTHSDYDIEVISNLVKMRLKSKPNHYISCMRELLTKHPDNLSTTMRRVVFNELSQQRNPSNMAILGVMFSYSPELSAKHLSAVFQELLWNREDYLRAIRALFREIVRALKHDINMVEFCRGLMQDRREPAFMELEQIYKDRILASVIDLITMACFLCVSPAVKELSTALAKGEKRDYSSIHNFQTQISFIQRDAIWFFHTKVKYLYNCNDKEFLFGLIRILFLDPSETYNQRDNWPPESERNTLVQLVTEVPLLEDSLLRLHLLGLSPDIPLSCDQALDMIEKLVHKAAVLMSNQPGLVIERLDVVKMLLSLAAYSYPKEITLPLEYEPPTLAITLLYWRAWLILLILSALNPATIGIYVWENYPTARYMMEMLITGCYEFPPFGSIGMAIDDARSKELQIARAEKDEIIVFEGHLAAATNGFVITENTSRLISQLISLAPTGPPRQPPTNVIKQLKGLNEKFKLGKLLCQCRHPDFLLSIIESQGSSKSMPWLADLVQSSESSLNALPLQCLCEFLLMKHNTERPSSSSKQKSIRFKVAGRLHDLLFGPEATQDGVSKLVQYFIDRWSSPLLKDRESSRLAFKTIVLHQKKSSGKTQSLSSDSEMDHQEKQASSTDPFFWMHEKMLTFPFLEDLLPQIVVAMTKALQVEMKPVCIQAYIMFISKKYHADMLPFIVDSLSQLVTKRKSVIDMVLSEATPNGTVTYKCLLRLMRDHVMCVLETSNSENKWQPDDPNLISWTEGLFCGKSAIMPLPLIRSCLNLLARGGSVVIGDEHYDFLWQVFFPLAHLKVKGEQVGGLWLDNTLKMLMLRSGHEQLLGEVLCWSSVVEVLSFIQMTAIPKHVHFALLERLDGISIAEPRVVLNSTHNKEHLVQVIENVRFDQKNTTAGDSILLLLRNAISEEEFGDSKPAPQSPTIVVVAPRISVISSSQKSLTSITSKTYDKDYKIEDIKGILKEAFSGSKPTNKEYLVLKRTLSKENIIKENGATAATVLLLLGQLCQDDDEFRSSFCGNRESCVLVRILSSSFVGVGKRNSPLSGGIQNQASVGDLTRLLEMLLESSSISKELGNLSRSILKQLGAGKTTVKVVKPLTSTLSLEQLLKTLAAEGKEITDNSSLLFRQLINALPSTSYGELDLYQMVKAGVRMFKEQRSSFEEFIKILCRHSTSKRDDSFCVSVLVALVRKLNEQENKGGSASGVIIDRLCRTDPEILQLNPVLLRELLFTTAATAGREEEEKPTLSKQQQQQHKNTSENAFTAYLISVMAHEIRNSTLQDCVQWMFSTTKNIDRLNATGCLDFATTLINNPRLWQGRDNKQQKDENKPSDGSMIDEEISPLLLSMPQIYQLIQIILMELTTVLSSKGEDTQEEGSKISSLMERRLSLLLNVSKNTAHLQKALNLAKSLKKYPENAMTCFLQYLYMKKPTICNLANDLKYHGNHLVLPMENKMEMDLVIHRLILSISEPDGSTEFKETFDSVSTLHRRIAAQHPFAFVRQLPLLLSLMKGKNRLTTINFKWTNQLSLCNHVFDLFDLLRPHVFTAHKISKNLIGDFVEVFLELIYAPCVQSEDVASFVSKLSKFMIHYTLFDGKAAGIVLKPRENIFRELLYDFPHFNELSSLASFMRAYDEAAQTHFTLVKPSQEMWNEAKLKSYQKRLSPGHHKQDLVAVLMELNDKSKIHIELIHHFVDELSLLVLSDEEEIRDASHKLLYRSFKNDPKNADQLVNIYTKCLSSNKPGVLMSAAKHSSRGLLLCQDKADILLLHMYKVAVTQHAHLDAHLSDVMKNLTCDF